jgi:intracellular multiplication protein IcmP
VFELWVASFIVGDDYSVIIPDVGAQYLSKWRHWLPIAKVEEIDYPVIRASTYVAVPALRPLLMALMGLMGVWAAFWGPGTHFRRRMGLEGLMREQARSFPVISPILKFNPQDMPHRVLGQAVPGTLPLFAEALSPEEWIAFHEIKVQNRQIDANQAYQALAQQLGSRWRGPHKLPLHVQGLYAAFALRHARKRKDSEDLLNQLALAWTPEGGLNLNGKIRTQIRQIINNPKLGGALQKYADQHAYETTAILRCLQRARDEGGVLAPASFLWLRGQDRTLWYPLNNLGRRSYHAEAVGALVHFTNELIARQKIPTPRFDEVIKGIEDTIHGPMGRPIPPLDKNAKFKFIKKKK